jgi:colanic acid/amylovoran biosynthesis protein
MSSVILNGQMRILIDPSTFDYLNMGDVAMLQVAVKRLRSMWPSATIQILTNDPEALTIHCPEVQPVDNKGRRIWFAEKDLLGRIHSILPKSVSQQLIKLKSKMRRHWPALMLLVIRSKGRLQRAQPPDPRPFLEALEGADLLVVSGAATLADCQMGHAKLLLSTLEWAAHVGKPVVMFGQGIGPLEDLELLRRASAVLPSVKRIAIREGVAGPQILESLKVAPDRIMVTGDDAVEPAYEARNSVAGDGIGINLRVAAYAEVNEDLLEQIKPILHDFARAHDAPLVPVPIKQVYDPITIRQLIGGYTEELDGGDSLNSPAKVIEQIGRCRLVVTGAYHAAVFALSQGIPSVCLAKSQYYIDKFQGLQDLFGLGCEMVLLEDEALPERLTTAMTKAWRSADEWRLPLREAAARQIKSGYRAYDLLSDSLRLQTAATTRG